MTAIDDIAAERKRQIEEEGWTAEHDDQHDSGELAASAACYAISATPYDITNPANGIFPYLWPVTWAKSWWKPTNRRRDLVKAGALIVAEIERLDRESERDGGKK
jgi:hypothetical protein